MDTIGQVKVRFDAAFKRYSSQSTVLLRLQAAAGAGADSAGIHGINAQSRKLSEAEQEYQTVRSEYADRLLDETP
jgi:hypothetical protein